MKWIFPESLGAVDKTTDRCPGAIDGVLVLTTTFILENQCKNRLLPKIYSSV
jgi:hypothetical protein